MATKKKQTKKDLEAKIAELEAKLSQISGQLAQKPAEAKAAPPPPPPPKPAETAKPSEPPKPAEKPAAPPATLDSVIEAVPMGNWHEQKTKTPAYVCDNPRAWARRHPRVAEVPTTNWSLQKSKIPGYTAPSERYFASRQRLAYHPPQLSFRGFGASVGQSQAAPPPPPPKPATRGSLPKGF